MMATIYDIADKTGLSPATVSRVLSGKKTSAENRQKVMEAARALNYHNLAYLEPERGHELSRSGSGRTILLAPGRNGSDGCYAAAQALGYSIQLLSLEDMDQAERSVWQLLQTGAAVGLILNQPLRDPFLETIAERYPVVSVGTYENPLLHKVWIDPLSAVQRLLQEFELLGRKRLMCCTTNYRGSVLSAEVIRSLLRPDTSLQVVEDADISKVFFSQAMGDHQPLVERILALPKAERPDALLVGNSVVASCMVNLLRIRGVRIPEEIAVASFIGGEHDLACAPCLTSVLPPYYELGYEAVRILDSLVSGKLVPNRVTYPHRIRIGGSTRPELGEFGERVE